MTSSRGLPDTWSCVPACARCSCAPRATEPQRVFAKEELLRAVWGYPLSVSTRTLDSHASRLRRKLRAEGDERWVVNVRGVGYRLI
jgi:DNA-binding response OmpR family regulator